MDNKNTRIAEILINKEWVKINPIDIKKGMLFRMFESTGEPVINKSNNSNQWLASDDAYYNQDGVITVNTII